VSGRLVLSDGRPASGAAIFLGDDRSDRSTLDQGKGYYYRTYADKDGNFLLRNVREGKWTLTVWPDGGSIGDVTTVGIVDDLVTRAGMATDIGKVTWPTQDRKKIWQIGDMDRKATGFKHSGAPHEHGRAVKCPANLTYTIGTSQTSDWCFAQWSPGTWSIIFDIPEEAIANNTSGSSAVLTVSLAGYSSGVQSNISINGVSVFALTSTIRGDPSLYRSATLSGEWNYFEFLVTGGGKGQSLLKEGRNRIDFTVKKSSQWRGLMFDSILLEWV
jgi:rhamnogalacturonan endolyase